MKPRAREQAEALGHPDQPDRAEQHRCEHPSAHPCLRVHVPGGILRPMPDATADRAAAAPAGCASARRRRDRSRPTARPRTRSSSSGATPARVPGHRPVARAAHPGRVRRGLRRHGRGRPGGHASSARPGRSPTTPIYELARDARRDARRGRLRGHHRRRPGDHGGRQSRLPGGRRPVGRLQHRAAPRAGRSTRTSTSASSSATSSRARSMFVKYADALRHPARRLRHARRAVRGADPHPDAQDPPLPGHPRRHGVLGRAARLDPRRARAGGADRAGGPRPAAPDRRPGRGRARSSATFTRPTTRPSRRRAGDGADRGRRGPPPSDGRSASADRAQSGGSATSMRPSRIRTG